MSLGVSIRIITASKPNNQLRRLNRHIELRTVTHPVQHNPIRLH